MSQVGGGQDGLDKTGLDPKGQVVTLEEAGRQAT